MILEELAEKTTEFVFDRQKEDGGFGATPHLPSTVEDTFYGLSILLTLSRPNDQKPVLAEAVQKSAHYLGELRPQTNWNPKTLYYYLMACRLVGIKTRPETLMNMDFFREEHEDVLEDLFYVHKIKSETGLKITGEEETGLPKIDLSQWRTARELWFKLGLAGRADNSQEPDRDRAMVWVMACQNPDGGFGFHPGTTSFIENCHICLMILKMLGGRPADPVATCKFILRCKTLRGGFARKNGGAPFLDATWHAVNSLEILTPLLDNP